MSKEIEEKIYAICQDFVEYPTTVYDRYVSQSLEKYMSEDNILLFGKYFLRMACYYRKDTSWIQYIIQRSKVNVNEYILFKCDDEKYLVTPLWIAVWLNNFKAVNILLENGAIIDKPSISKNGDDKIFSEVTPLFLPCYKGNMEIIKHLIEKGADIHKINAKKLVYDLKL